MSSFARTVEWRAVAAGLAAHAVVVAAATSPERIQPTTLRMLVVCGLGLPGGAVAGSATDGGARAGLRHGLLAGGIGGALVGALLVYTFRQNETRGVFWAVNYWLVTTVPFPGWLVVAYGEWLVAGIGLASAVVFAAGSAAAGFLAAGPRRVVPAR